MWALQEKENISGLGMLLRHWYAFWQLLKIYLESYILISKILHNQCGTLWIADFCIYSSFLHFHLINGNGYLWRKKSLISRDSSSLCLWSCHYIGISSIHFPPYYRYAVFCAYLYLNESFIREYNISSCSSWWRTLLLCATLNIRASQIL